MNIDKLKYKELVKYAREVGVKFKGFPKRDALEAFVRAKVNMGIFGSKKSNIKVPKYTISIPGKPIRKIY